MLGYLLAGLAGLILYKKSQGGSAVGAGGSSAAIVDISPLSSPMTPTGHRHANVALGQTLRVNLPREWFLMEDLGVDPATAPMQRVPSRGIGGITFTAAGPGTQTLLFAKHGSLDTIAIDVSVQPSAATGYYGAGYYGAGYRGGFRGEFRALPYRDFWGRFRATDPYWRWRESQWRLNRHWEPAWGPQPPPPSDPAVDVIEPAAA